MPRAAAAEDGLSLCVDLSYSIDKLGENVRSTDEPGASGSAPRALPVPVRQRAAPGGRRLHAGAPEVPAAGGPADDPGLDRRAVPRRRGQLRPDLRLSVPR